MTGITVRSLVLVLVLSGSQSALTCANLCFSSPLARSRGQSVRFPAQGTVARSPIFRPRGLSLNPAGRGRREHCFTVSSGSLQCASEAGAGQQRFFAFEGIIGAGKSTLLAELEAGGIKVVPEPLERWQETGIFSAFYGNMTRWSYTFQMQAFISRVKSIEQNFEQHPGVHTFVGERSWFADSFVFEPLLHRDGHISDIEHAAYREWWEWMQDKIPKTSGIIYLRASPETCLARIQKRSRAEESNIPLSYLQGLFRQHERWLMEKETPYGGADAAVPVLVLDADLEFKSNPERLQQMLQEVAEFTADPAKHAEAARDNVRGSVDRAGWQAFKLNDSSEAKNSSKI